MSHIITGVDPHSPAARAGIRPGDRLARIDGEVVLDFIDYQALTARRRRFPLYVLGWLAAIGLLVGRFVCGWLCLFGLMQELLYKIPTPKLRIPDKIDRPLRYLKYGVLALLVVGLPLLWRGEYGAGVPFFCEYLCPVGTLEGGVPLVLLNDVLRPALGWLFRWKLLILIVCILSSIFIYRPFCKYLCPLGAFYALFQRASLIRMRVDASACVNCGKCAGVCPMQVDPSKSPNSTECIRCGECTKVCPKGALSFTAAGRELSPRKRKEPVSHEKETDRTDRCAVCHYHRICDHCVRRAESECLSLHHQPDRRRGV